MTFRDQIAQDASKTFLNTDECAEEVSYTPYGQSVALIFDALIVRKQIEPDGQVTRRILDRQCEVFIANDDDEGVASVTKGKDKIWFPVYEGDATSVEWGVIDILDKDNGMWHLLVQR